MRIVCIGGGPAGLYFALLMKKADPSHDITVVERNAPNVTFGWGVVFSDETLENLFDSDPESAKEITATFAHWQNIETWFKGRWIRSGGHGFSGIARKHLLGILQRRCEQLGVNLVYDTEVNDLDKYADADLIVASDGVRSFVRAQHETSFRPQVELNPCRYIWLGTNKVFDAFTFLFERNDHGIFQVHAYRFDAETSTFIAECDEESWRNAGLDTATPEETVAYLEKLFGRHLDGNPLLVNKSQWIQFNTLKNESWRHGKTVLIGDAAHTAHFSIGSGTKLAVEDAIALASAVQRHASVEEALAAYEAERRPIVERTQKAAQDSRTWFETVRRHWHLDPEPFVFSLLTRSKKISYANLKVRDAGYADDVTRWYARSQGVTRDPAPPPMFTPMRLRGMELANRVVVSPMCMYSSEGGLPNDFHLVHLGERALGGAGLVFTEMTDVSPEGRITHACAGMWSPEHAAAWKRIVDFVHARSGARIGMQLAHAGRKGSVEIPWLPGGDQPLPTGAWETLAPSAIPFGKGWPAPRAMTTADIVRVQGEFVRAAQLAEQAGFDALELHAAHGYLFHQFLSPISNQRGDAYGGSLQNRMRFLLETFEAVRAVWPHDKPISVRVSATDWVVGGFTCPDAVVLARELKALGLDIMDVSSGGTSPDARPVYGRMYQTPFSDEIRNTAGIPTMTVGNINSADQVNTILAAGRADLVVMARAHLLDPHWTLRAGLELGHDEQRWPPQYLLGKRIPRT